MSRTAYAALAIAAALLAIVVFAWLDTTVLDEARRDAAAEFNSARYTQISSVISILLMAAIFAMALVAWRSASWLVGVAYVAIGGFLAFLPAITMTLAVGRNDVPPVLPEQLSRIIAEVLLATTGPMGAVGILGAGMLVIGAAVLARALRGGPERAVAATAPVEAPG